MAESATLKALMRWPNRRRQRVQSIVAEVMRIVNPYLDELDARRRAAVESEADAPPRPQRDVYDELMVVLSAVGIEIVTDHDRRDVGLPPRGPDGWTIDELHALEAARLERTLSPPPMMILSQGSL